MKPTQKANWVAFAMAYHLAGDHAKAIRILTELENTEVCEILEILRTENLGFGF